jgi:cytochrome c oxidase cbb3-type subunit III
MMGQIERDQHSGYMTTGHEWNGIKELNTPVPRFVLFCLIAAAIFSLTYTVLLPAWPYGTDYTKGTLEVDQRREVEEALRTAVSERSTWTDRVLSGDLDMIRADPVLMDHIREAGRTLFGDNCAGCHGLRANGGAGYPSFRDNAWLWGGNAEAIAETIRVGVNSTHEDSRSSEMLAFGRDQILEREQVLAVTAFVMSLSNPGIAKGARARQVESGGKIYAENCTDCHGVKGKGNAEVGAPNLTDGFWLYGGDEESIFRSIMAGRKGTMPHWEGRLGELERKLLMVYIADLSGASE